MSLNKSKKRKKFKKGSEGSVITCDWNGREECMEVMVFGFGFGFDKI